MKPRMQIWHWWQRKSSSKGNQAEDIKAVVHPKKIHFKVCHQLKKIKELSVFTVAELVILLQIVIKRRLMKLDIDTRGMQGILLVKIIIMILSYLCLMLLFLLGPMKLKLGLCILDNPLIWQVINTCMKILRRPTMALTSTLDMT